ncbi:hypothetical protein AURDEDRAFT_168402 [Auricularia subglabra TFB-10046 SS5]|nr:hypothetical protein AURDEDRAFT_168402 [Auricularia subglabra TFB-10046 SS5]
MSLARRRPHVARPPPAACRSPAAGRARSARVRHSPHIARTPRSAFVSRRRLVAVPPRARSSRVLLPARMSCRPPAVFCVPPSACVHTAARAGSSCARDTIRLAAQQHLDTFAQETTLLSYVALASITT